MNYNRVTGRTNSKIIFTVFQTEKLEFDNKFKTITKQILYTVYNIKKKKQ